MDLPSTAELPMMHTLAGGRWRHEMLRVLGVTAASLLLLVAAIVVWRRLAGALSSPLAPQTMLSAAVAVAILAIAARTFLGSQVGGFRSIWAERAIAASMSAAVFALAWSISIPQTTMPAIVLLWSVLVVEESWTWKSILFRQHGAGREAGKEASPPRVPQTKPSTSHCRSQT